MSADFDNDGWPDIYVACDSRPSFLFRNNQDGTFREEGLETNVLYMNDGKGHFDDVTIRAGLGVEARYLSWGAGIVDLDNDGLPDLFVVTGSVYPEIERRLTNYPSKTPRLIFRNLGDGRFEELIEEAGPGTVAAHSSRGCAFGDFDNDGDLDVLIMNTNEPRPCCGTTSPAAITG